MNKGGWNMQRKILIGKKGYAPNKFQEFLYKQYSEAIEKLEEILGRMKKNPDLPQKIINFVENDIIARKMDYKKLEKLLEKQLKW
jgi:hypothetical protein